MNNNIDLNIENYNLDELLNLFNINYNFTEEDLKNAKKKVLRTHPDKSKLPKDYFLFYSKAYKYLYKIFDFRKKKNLLEKNPDYDSNEIDNENKLLLKQQFKNNKDFHKWFNKMFDNLYIKDDYSSNGYGDWLSSSENTFNLENKTKDEQELILKNYKKELRIVNKINEPFIHTQCSNIINESTDNYQNSDIFSKLPFEDVKKAHTETIIPIDETVDKNKQFNNVFEYQLYRKNQKFEIMSEETSSNFFKNKHVNETSNATQQAFKLIKQEEKSIENNNIFWSKLKLLNNKI
tara:strand:+ start:1523 stop:2398 length:876 start_codon:yes stop_codon:yes gene_type:complete